MNLFRRILALAFNAAAERCLAYSVATNIAPITDEQADEYRLVARYGDLDYYTADGKGGVKKLIQRFTPGQAKKIAANFASYREKQGKDFIGMPIYAGHPDADHTRWPDERRYGHVLDVQDRADGLYIKPAWNDLGLDNKKNHYLPYPSIAWKYEAAATQRSGIIEPDEIQSVGLTNQPRMKDVPPWTNIAEAGEDNQTIRQSDNQTDDPIMKEKLIKLLGLATNATDEEIAAACEGKLAINATPTEVALGAEKVSIILAGDNRADFLAKLGGLASNAATMAFDLKTVQTQLSNAQTLATNAQAEAARFRDLAINSALDRGIDKGLITAAERDGFKVKLTADFDAGLAELGARKAAINTTPLPKLTPGAGADLSTPKGRAIAFNARIDELTNPAANGGKALSIDAALQVMRGNAEDAALLKAMEPTAQ